MKKASPGRELPRCVQCGHDICDECNIPAEECAHCDETMCVICTDDIDAEEDE